MTTEDYKKIADTIPKQPGVYRFLDENDVILQALLANAHVTTPRALRQLSSKRQTLPPKKHGNLPI